MNTCNGRCVISNPYKSICTTYLMHVAEKACTLNCLNYIVKIVGYNAFSLNLVHLNVLGVLPSVLATIKHSLTFFVCSCASLDTCML